MIESMSGSIPHGASNALEPARETDAQTPSSTGGKEFKLFGADGFSFFDFLDVINPLQHIPVISTLYRKITGDELSPGARIAGATLFGGPIGAAVAIADTAVEYETGRDIGATALAFLTGDDTPSDAPKSGTAVAEATGSARGLAAMSGGGAGLAAGSAYLAATVPDLGALASFDTAAGPGTAMPPLVLEPRFASTAHGVRDAAPWRDPDAIQPAAPWRDPDAVPQIAALHEHAAPAPRPLKPTGPAGDVPKGAAAALSRQTLRAYANSLAHSPELAQAVANDRSAMQRTIDQIDAAASGTRNDWVLDAMSRAMAKYQAGMSLGSAAAQPSLSVVR